MGRALVLQNLFLSNDGERVWQDVEGNSFRYNNKQWALLLAFVDSIVREYPHLGFGPVIR